jgi:hypothetical protein
MVGVQAATEVSQTGVEQRWAKKNRTGESLQIAMDYHDVD